MPLEPRVVIVTGAGSGIGRGIAIMLAQERAKVVIAEIDQLRGSSVADEIRENNGEAFCVPTDVASEDSVADMVEKTLSRWGAIDGLVNNAGIFKEAEISSLSAADWDRVLTVNLKSMFLCARAVLPSMRRQGGGSIVNIASVHAYFGFEGHGAYDASKGGIVALTRTLALENGPFQIRANVVCPGYIDTPMWDEWLATLPDPGRMDRETREWHPLRRRGTPADVAKAVRFLLSNDSDWITGASLVVDGGLSIRYFGY
ncbi:MAG TPA: SDR family NAD(P)-dependent oxidoreductase [Terriglobia bacterium]|nr:SDR family NAD(P)-dependent oxidoreductase [Terriglobia bacterium]